MRCVFSKLLDLLKYEKKETKEFCMNCGQRTAHELVRDDQGEYWKVCKRCGRREYVGMLR
ncbi:hypothetical protein DRN79_04085 [Methanosarcinales archaeon]|nr:MAG: hypothetical protein DRN79_04085 [Methanosarcinales archaeon]